MSKHIDALAKASAEYAKALKAIQRQTNPSEEDLKRVQECKKKLKEVKKEYLEK